MTTTATTTLTAHNDATSPQAITIRWHSSGSNFTNLNPSNSDVGSGSSPSSLALEQQELEHATTFLTNESSSSSPGGGAADPSLVLQQHESSSIPNEAELKEKLRRALQEHERLKAAQTTDKKAINGDDGDGENDRPRSSSREYRESLGTIANIYVELMKLHEALEMEEELLALVMEEIAAMDDNDDDDGERNVVITANMDRIGHLNVLMGHSVEAKKWLKHSLKLKKQFWLDQKGFAYHADIGRTLYILSTLSSEVEQRMAPAMRLLEEAEDHYRHHELKRKYNTREEKTGGNGDGDGAISSISEILDPKNDQCTTEKKTVPGSMEAVEPHPDILLVLEEQALLFRRNMEHKEALLRYEEISQMFPSIANSLEHQFHIADCLIGDDRFKESLELYNNMLQNVKEGSNDEAQLRHRIGVCHARENRLQDALESYHSSLDLYRQLYGTFHYDVGSVLNCIGAVYGTMGEKERALGYFREALVVFKTHAGPEADENIDVLNTLGNISMVRKSGIKTAQGTREDPLSR